MKRDRPQSEPKVVYRRSRLLFLADKIEPLRSSDAFQVVTPYGTFQMTKKEFYNDFSNVVNSASYRGGVPSTHGLGMYAYWKVPQKAYKYQIDEKIEAPRRRYRRAVVRPVAEQERRELGEIGLASSKEIVRRRCRTILASLAGKSPGEIAEDEHRSRLTITLDIHAFNDYGLSSVWRHGSDK